MKGFSTLVVVLFGLAGISVAHAAESADQKFVKEAAVANMAEVELATLAREKATQADVKQYAEHMIQDHQSANEKLKTLASQKGIELPTEVDGKHKREKERLSKMEGPDFDRAYIQAMVKDHKEVLNKFEKQAKSGKDSELKNFAAQTTPALRQHLQQAQQVEKNVKDTKKQAGS